MPKVINIESKARQVGSNRTVGVGSGRGKGDWTVQTSRFYNPVTGKAKPFRRKCLKNEVVVDGLTIYHQATINRIEKIRVPVERKDGTIGEREQMIGYHNGKRVMRDGYAYAFVNGGRTPGRWYYV